MPGYTEMNNAVKHLVTISAQSRASKTYGEEHSERKQCNPLRRRKSIKAEYQPKATKGAVMVEGLRQQSVPTRDDPQHKTCAHQVSETSRRKATRPEEPRIGIKRKRIRNRPLPCQMPCSDRGIRSEEESVAIGRIRPEWYR